MHVYICTYVFSRRPGAARLRCLSALPIGLGEDMYIDIYIYIHTYIYIYICIYKSHPLGWSLGCLPPLPMGLGMCSCIYPCLSLYICVYIYIHISMYIQTAILSVGDPEQRVSVACLLFLWVSVRIYMYREI